MKKKKHPKFLRMNYGRRTRRRIGRAWRRPRGIDNKQRVRMKYVPKSPRIGYKNPESIRGIHPLGLPEILVHNPNELIGIKDKLVRISSSVGKRKRELIEKKAAEMGLRVL